MAPMQCSEMQELKHSNKTPTLYKLKQGQKSLQWCSREPEQLQRNNTGQWRSQAPDQLRRRRSSGVIRWCSSGEERCRSTVICRRSPLTVGIFHVLRCPRTTQVALIFQLQQLYAKYLLLTLTISPIFRLRLSIRWNFNLCCPRRSYNFAILLLLLLGSYQVAGLYFGMNTFYVIPMVFILVH